jgi:glycosyltransferase involved in cell wall biosynthesis
VPLVAVDSGVHRDVIADGGAIVAAADLPDAVIDALGAGERRLRVLAADRARAFSWASSAERLWALHAEL